MACFDRGNGKAFFMVNKGRRPKKLTLLALCLTGHMTDHAGPRRYECNPVFQIVTREICNLVLKLHNPMKICGTR